MHVDPRAACPRAGSGGAARPGPARRAAGSGLRGLASSRPGREEWLARILGGLAGRGDVRAGYVAEGLSQGFRYSQALGVERDFAASAALEAGVPGSLRGAWWRGLGL